MFPTTTTTKILGTYTRNVIKTKNITHAPGKYTPDERNVIANIV